MDDKIICRGGEGGISISGIEKRFKHSSSLLLTSGH
jgi:hypothetical protein